MYLAYRKVLLPVVTVLWMSMIFWFSAAPAEESTDMSLSAGSVVARILNPDFNKLTESEQKAFVEKIEHPVRKSAHAGEYALLGILFMGSLGAYGIDGRRRAIAAWICTTAYAATDELHQLFVAGRSCQVSDVVLDSTGAAAGILLYIAVFWIVGHKTRYCRKKP